MYVSRRVCIFSEVKISSEQNKCDYYFWRQPTLDLCKPARGNIFVAIVLSGKKERGFRNSTALWMWLHTQLTDMMQKGCWSRKDIKTLSGIIWFRKAFRKLWHISITNLIIYNKRNLCFNTFCINHFSLAIRMFIQRAATSFYHQILDWVLCTQIADVRNHCGSLARLG
jgi:hypothetical protein